MSNKAQLARMTRMLGTKFDTASFDYQTGRVLPTNVHRRKLQLQLRCYFILLHLSKLSDSQLSGMSELNRETA